MANFVINVLLNGVRQTAAGLTSIEKSASGANSVVGEFRKGLILLSGVRAAKSMLEFADSAIRVENRLRSLNLTQEQYARANQFLRDTSREFRTDLEANAVIYSRLLRSTSELGISTEKFEKIFRGLSASIKVGGATSQEAKNALIQFSQAMASGKLSGDELRSVAEQLPVLADAIGAKFGVAKGQLLGFAKANPGIINAQKALEGVYDAADQLIATSKGMTVSISDSFTLLSNKFTEMLGDAQQTVGVLSILSSAIVFVSDNIDSLVIAVTAAGAALAVMKGLSLYETISSIASAATGATIITRGWSIAQIALNKALQANPYILVATVVASLGFALYELFQHTEAGRAVMSAIGTVFSAVAQSIINLVNVVFGALSPAMSGLVEIFSGLWQLLTQVGLAIYPLWQGLAGLGSAFISWATQTGVANAATQLFLFSVKELFNLFAVGISIVIVPFVVAFQGVINILAQFGVVAPTVVAQVNAVSNQIYGAAANLGIMALGLQGVTNTLTTSTLPTMSMANAAFNQTSYSAAQLAMGTQNVSTASAVAAASQTGLASAVRVQGAAASSAAVSVAKYSTAHASLTNTVTSSSQAQLASADASNIAKEAYDNARSAQDDMNESAENGVGSLNRLGSGVSDVTDRYDTYTKTIGNAALTFASFADDMVSVGDALKVSDTYNGWKSGMANYIRTGSSSGSSSSGGYSSGETGNAYRGASKTSTAQTTYSSKSAMYEDPWYMSNSSTMSPAGLSSSSGSSSGRLGFGGNSSAPTSDIRHFEESGSNKLKDIPESNKSIARIALGILKTIPSALASGKTDPTEAALYRKIADDAYEHTGTIMARWSGTANTWQDPENKVSDLLTNYAKKIGATERNVEGFRNGGTFTIPGSGRPDSKMARIAVSPGEEVEVRKRKTAKQVAADANSRSDRPIVVNFQVSAMDTDSFRRTQSQITRDLINGIKIAARETGV